VAKDFPTRTKGRGTLNLLEKKKKKATGGRDASSGEKTEGNTIEHVAGKMGTEGGRNSHGYNKKKVLAGRIEKYKTD